MTGPTIRTQLQSRWEDLRKKIQNQYLSSYLMEKNRVTRFYLNPRVE